MVVLDDDPGSQRLLRVILERDGARVDTYGDAEPALAAMEESPPDVLVLDWFMSGLDGPDVLRRLRSSPVLQTLYCILVTAQPDETRKVTGLLLGADDFLVKPVAPEELQARVRVGLRIRHMERNFNLLTLAATLGHEINNPLTGVLGYLEVLEDALQRGDGARARTAAGRVRSSAEKIRDVVRRLAELKSAPLRRYSTGRFMIDLEKRPSHPPERP